MSSVSGRTSNEKLELKNRIAFQGELGAYSQSAVYSFFGRDTEVLPLPTLHRVFSELCVTGEKDRLSPSHAVVPIENSTAGSVGETFDLLVTSNVRIIGETTVPVQHCLVIHKDSDLSRIRRVISHPQALAQCRNYLNSRKERWKQEAVYDTAGAVKMIREDNLLETAAIASELACQIYEMKLAEKNIEDDHTNRTRFVVLVAAPKLWKQAPTGHDKTSVIFSTKHLPGSLVRALSSLSFRGINLSRIESRPIKSKPWEYYFYVDFDGHEEDEQCRQALEDLQTQTTELKVLGSYPRAI